MANAKYQPLGMNVLIKAKVKTKHSSGIIMPYQSDDLDEMLNREKEIFIEDEKVFAIGPNVTEVKPGDSVHTLKKGLRFINKTKCEQFNLERTNDEVYFLIGIENVLAVIS